MHEFYSKIFKFGIFDDFFHFIAFRLKKVNKWIPCSIFLYSDGDVHLAHYDTTQKKKKNVNLTHHKQNKQTYTIHSIVVTLFQLQTVNLIDQLLENFENIFFYSVQQTNKFDKYASKSKLFSINILVFRLQFYLCVQLVKLNCQKFHHLYS